MILRRKSVFIHFSPPSFQQLAPDVCKLHICFLLVFHSRFYNDATGFTAFSPGMGSFSKFDDSFLVHWGKDKSACKVSRNWGLVNHKTFVKQVGRMMSCGIPQGSLVRAALLTWPSIFSGKLVQDPAIFRFGLACWIWELKWMAHISASNYREQMRVFPVACSFQAKAVPSCSLLCLFLYSCPEAKMSAYPQALAAPQTCPWESCKYPIFQSIIFLPFFLPAS